jgi:protein-disulfide isomerase
VPGPHTLNQVTLSPYTPIMSRIPLVALLCTGLACLACNSKSGEASARSSQVAAAPAVPAATAAPGANSAGADSLLDAADHGRVLGSETATLWLLMVSDFQCPYCKQWHDETFATLKKEYIDAGKIRVAYMNFPLQQHQNAWPSAMAAMCASAQGKFWATQDRIFATQKSWESLSNATAYLDSLAIASGADATKQHACTKDRQLRSLIDRDQLRMRQAGVQSTPTFFVGSRTILGAQPADSFRKVIDSVLKAGGR